MASFGETLKRERETRNISLREVASATKISLRYIEALEENRFEVLPGGVFNKGFVRACANHLGLDGEAMLAHYLREVAERSTPRIPAPAAVTSMPAPRAPSPLPPATVAPAPVASAPVAPAAPPPLPFKEHPRSPTITFATEEAPPPRRSRGLLVALGVVAAASLIPVAFRVFSTDEDFPETETLPAQPAMTRQAPEQVSGAPPLAGFEVPETVGATRTPEPAAAAEEKGWLRPEPVPPAPTNAAPSAERRLSAVIGSPAPAKTRPAEASRSETTVRAGAEPPQTAPAAAPPARTVSADTVGPPAGADREAENPPVVRRAVPAPAFAAGGLAARPHTGAPVAAAPQPETMSVQIESTRKTWVYLFCDSAEVIDRNMLPGESLRFTCLSVIRASAHDAGAVHLAINGARCMPLGEDGAEVYGYTIRVDDFRLICPRRVPAGGGRP